MKQPTLIVEGNRHAVIKLEWFDGKPVQASIMKNGIYTIYHDVSQPYYVEPQLKIEIEKSLLPSTEQLEVIAERITKQIQYYDASADDLAHSYIQSDKPFPNELKQRYDAIGCIIDGLQEALDIVMTLGGDK